MKRLVPRPLQHSYVYAAYGVVVSIISMILSDVSNFLTWSAFTNLLAGMLILSRQRTLRTAHSFTRVRDAFLCALYYFSAALLTLTSFVIFGHLGHEAAVDGYSTLDTYLRQFLEVVPQADLSLFYRRMGRPDLWEAYLNLNAIALISDITFVTIVVGVFIGSSLATHKLFDLTDEHSARLSHLATHPVVVVGSVGFLALYGYGTMWRVVGSEYVIGRAADRHIYANLFARAGMSIMMYVTVQIFVAQATCVLERIGRRQR